MADETPSWRPARALCDASIQEIQLELIRRTRHNAFDGPRVAESLLRNRGNWSAVLMDRNALGSPLIKLRDLPDDVWNVD